MMNLGLFRSISALNQQPLPETIGQIRLRSLHMGTIHQPGNQLMGGHGEINIPLGMAGKTKLAVQPLHGGSNPGPAECIRVSIASGYRTAPLQFTTGQNLQGCGEILLTTDATAVGSEQSQLGSIRHGG